MTKFTGLVEENEAKRKRIEDLERIVQILRNEKTRTENELNELRATTQREIDELKEKLATRERDDPQLVEERLQQALIKLKSDFRLMFERQSNFVVEKIEHLKEEQQKNIGSLYKS